MKHPVLLLVSIVLGACAQAASPGGSASGSFRMQGKDATLSHSRAAPGRPFADEPTIDIALTEKDASAADHLSFISASNTYGAALEVKIYKNEQGNYQVIGSGFGHPASKRPGAGGIGILDIRDVKVGGGRISGEVVSVPDASLFNESVEVDVRFDAPFSG